MTTTVVLREASVEAITKVDPKLLPAEFERRAKGRGHQCVYQIADVSALADGIVKLMASVHSAQDRASIKTDLSRLRGSVPVKAAKPAAKGGLDVTVEAADTAAPVDPETRDVVAVNPYRTFKHNCKCGKGWDQSGVSHCKVCHVSYGDAKSMLAHNTGDHMKFRPCLHPLELDVVDNGHDVWVAA